jgi:hypothetical protein
MLKARGVEVSYSNLALWVRSGRFPGAQLDDSHPRGVVWRIPADAVNKFVPPKRGPKPKASKKGGKK